MLSTALRNGYDAKGCFLVWKCCDFPEETESLQQSRSERQQGLLAAQQFLLPGRHVCKAHLCALTALETGGSLLWGQSSTSTHPPYERPHPEAQTASLRLSRALMMQQRLLHLTWCSVCHYLEAEIRGCPVLQQILFSKLCLWSPPERAHFLDSSPKQRHRVCTGRTEEPPSCKGLVNF